MTNSTRYPDFLAELAALDASVAALFTTPPDQLARQPAHNKWSALQAIDHLVLTNREYFPSIERTIRNSRAAGVLPAAPFHHSWLGRSIVALFEPPPKLRFPLPSRRIAPGAVPDAADVRRAFEENHAHFRAYIQDALTVDMRRAKVHSPFLAHRWASISLGTAIGALLAHERRHLYQARAAVK